MLKLWATTAALAITAAPASAAILHWTVTGASFDDGASLTGSFDVDSTNNQASNFNLSVTGGTLAAGSYTNGDSEFLSFSPTNYIFAHRSSPTSYDRYLTLDFGQSLTTAGTFALSLSSSTSYECGNCSPIRYLTSGSVTTNAEVPEPAMLGLFGLGALGLGLARRRKAA